MGHLEGTDGVGTKALGEERDRQGEEAREEIIAPTEDRHGQREGPKG